MTGTDQNVFWAVTGVAPNRELVVEWRNVRHYSCNGDGTATVNFQAVFFESSSDVLFNYGDTVFAGACAFADSGASATVGIQTGTTAGNATQFSVDTPSLAGNTALLWTVTAPSEPGIGVTPASLGFGTAGLVFPCPVRHGRPHRHTVFSWLFVMLSDSRAAPLPSSLNVVS